MTTLGPWGSTDILLAFEADDVGSNPTGPATVFGKDNRDETTMGHGERMPKSQRATKGRSRIDSKTKGSKRVTAIGLVSVGIVVIMVLSVFVGLTTRGRSSISITMGKTINNSPLL
jgi:hypothetical protein